jgi:hypothetical protein
MNRVSVLIMAAQNNVCRDFLKGQCTRSSCLFSHNTEKQAPRYRKAPVLGGLEDSEDDNLGQAYMHSASLAPLKGKRNTESFSPLDQPVDMRILTELSGKRIALRISARDVVMAPNIFADFKPLDIYAKLTKEIEACGINDLMQLWHRDSHFIANDRTRWKRQCPTFSMIIDRIAEFFDMRVEATRLNWYKDTAQWKPFHHDAAALKEDKAQVQNFTVAVSFGATRDVAFEEVKSKTVVSMPQPDGWTYCFARDVNILWRHGVLQEKQIRDEGRISVVAWGYVDNLSDTP